MALTPKNTQIGPALWSWSGVVKHLTCLRNGTDLRINKAQIPHPSKMVNFRRSTGWHVRGAQRHWRATLPDNRCIHAIEREGDYLIHLDQVDPGVDLAGHLAQDTPGFFTLLSIGAGMVIGAGVVYAVTEGKESGSGGAVVGGVIASLFAAASMGPERTMESVTDAIKDASRNTGRKASNKGGRRE